VKSSVAAASRKIEAMAIIGNGVSAENMVADGARQPGRRIASVMALAMSGMDAGCDISGKMVKVMKRLSK